MQETFAALYPAYYEENADAFTFLLGIEGKIHELVRRLCRLLEGLILGTAEHCGETVVVEEIQCMHDGDPGCVFTVTRAEP